MADDLWIAYEAGARGLSDHRLNGRRAVTGPTDTERMWARLVIDAALPYIRQMETTDD
jgi:hypothetical protein